MRNDAPIAVDELRISVEAGAKYHASPRVAAALQELASALEQADSDDDVVGFADARFQPGFSMFYVGKADFSYTVSSEPSQCSSLEDPTVVRIRLRRDVLDNYAKFEAGHGDNGSLILALALADEIPDSLPMADQSQTGIFRDLTAM